MDGFSQTALTSRSATSEEESKEKRRADKRLHQLLPKVCTDPASVQRVVVAGLLPISAILKSSLGPEGTQKVVETSSKTVLVTEDGEVLLTNLSIANPLLKLVRDSAVQVGNRCGDGCKRTFILCTAILTKMEFVLSRSSSLQGMLDTIHTYDEFVQSIFPRMLQRAEVVSTPHCMPLQRRPLRDRARAVLNTLLANKLSPSLLKRFSELIVETFLPLPDTLMEATEACVHHIRTLIKVSPIVKVLGSPAESSKVVEGVMLFDPFFTSRCPNQIENVRCVYMDEDPTLSLAQAPILLSASTAEDYRRIVQWEEKRAIQLGQKLREKGVTCVLLSEGGALDFVNSLAQFGITCIKCDEDDREVLFPKDIFSPCRLYRRETEDVLLTCDVVEFRFFRKVGIGGRAYAHFGPLSKVFCHGVDARQKMDKIKSKPKHRTILLGSPTDGTFTNFRQILRKASLAVLQLCLSSLQHKGTSLDVQLGGGALSFNLAHFITDHLSSPSSIEAGMISACMKRVLEAVKEALLETSLSALKCKATQQRKYSLAARYNVSNSLLIGQDRVSAALRPIRASEASVLPFHPRSTESDIIHSAVWTAKQMLDIDRVCVGQRQNNVNT
uniref:Uncharacterized protein n=1 Tax=Palpitomonas bilix TaxID=652834 RepID=A0A7S3GHV8_9EUKA|mmetsp:Transcript_50110/g.128975  ORF Transcript_50110/g.128975 Transcript_50110/m.128975 type:complete len:613 (+) Transcript_50110:178-2016(+)